MKLSAKGRKALLAATTADEAAAALSAEGVEATAEDAERVLAEVRAHAKGAEGELSADELAAITGGADRDWITDGCAYTTEVHKYCIANDACTLLWVTYEHRPYGYCNYCGGVTFNCGSFQMECTRCGARMDRPYTDDTII